MSPGWKAIPLISLCGEGGEGGGRVFYEFVDFLVREVSRDCTWVIADRSLSQVGQVEGVINGKELYCFHWVAAQVRSQSEQQCF